MTFKNKFLTDYGVENPVRRNETMAKMKDMAKDYTPKATPNISELEKVSVDVEIKEEEFTTEEGDTFKVNIAIVEGKKYRVPNMVLKQLKAILTKKPYIKYISVVKDGEGLKTSYSVVEAD